MSANAVRSAGSSWRVRREVARLDKQFERSGGPLVERFGEETATVMRAEFLEEYRRLVPGVPDIGGRRNPYTPYLMSAGARCLAVYRTILRHGGTLEDTGELFNHMQRAETDRAPRVILHWMGRHRILGWSPRQFKKWIRRTQARRYPDDCVGEWVDGDGESFDYGFDVTECATLNYLQAQGADELLPYLCDLDYIVAEKTGIELRRTKTLSWGCYKCDFRYVLGGSTTAPWPPRFVERTCGQPNADQPESAPSSRHVPIRFVSRLPLTEVSTIGTRRRTTEHHQPGYA